MDNAEEFAYVVCAVRVFVIENSLSRCHINTSVFHHTGIAAACCICGYAVGYRQIRRAGSLLHLRRYLFSVNELIGRLLECFPCLRQCLERFVFCTVISEYGLFAVVPIIEYTLFPAFPNYVILAFVCHVFILSVLCRRLLCMSCHRDNALPSCKNIQLHRIVCLCTFRPSPLANRRWQIPFRPNGRILQR